LGSLGKRFGAVQLVPVRTPFRLDLTVDALRRLASNAVDVVGPDGAYYRAVRDGNVTAMLAVRARDDGTIELRTTGRDGERWLPMVQRLLGTTVNLSDWYARCRQISWLQPIALALRGLKPPRYSSLWEACAHSIVFQQISIHAAAAIMRRAVQALGDVLSVEGIGAVVFPDAQRWLSAGDAELRAVGLSRNKMAHIRSAAAAFADGAIAEAELGPLSTAEAAQRLCEVRGIGPWSASVILLRGLGRLDVFPLRDSGVARSLRLLAGEPNVDESALLAQLGATRGMLYYHLLLGRLRNLVPA
jgi:DNA-3-methyladenine glycosylase II